MSSDVSEGHRSSRTSVPSARRPLGVEDMVHHLRTGRTVTGEPVRPYKWLDFAGGERSPMELRVSRVMESCSFKSALSCVLGRFAAYSHVPRYPVHTYEVILHLALLL